MRHLLAFVLIIALVGSAAAADLGNVQKIQKNNSQITYGTPDGRQGGDIGNPTLISALPYSDTGNTANNVDDFDVACNFTGSTSPDAWYSFTPAADVAVDIDLLGSAYDTKVYVLDSTGGVVACNDDFYPDYVSFLGAVALTGGEAYAIAVDGYGGASGDYVLNITEFVPCLPPCTGFVEGEPTLVPGYVDNFNGGCNTEGTTPFQALEADEFGNLVFCGVSGWYDTSRDTDWLTIVIGDSGTVEWTLASSAATTGYQLGPLDCATVAVIDGQVMEATNCNDALMTITGNPGDIAWIWIGPSSFDGTGDFNYTASFTGLAGGVVATESMSFDGVKSLYR